jgi:tRNA A37 threonylcarbamoyladenosine modification protein TsaB
MITLLISSSFSQFKVLISRNNEILFHSDKANFELGNQEIAVLVAEGLRMAKIEAQAIDQVIVDRGPGGTSATRSGVAIANSLAYGLQKPVYSISSIEIMCLKIWKKHRVPVICTVKSINDYAFIGYFENEQICTISYGKLEDVIPKLIKNSPSIVIVGQHNDGLKNIIQSTQIIEEKLEYCDIEFMNSNLNYIIQKDTTVNNIVLPITENNI